MDLSNLIARLFIKGLGGFKKDKKLAKYYFNLFEDFLNNNEYRLIKENIDDYIFKDEYYEIKKILN